MEAPKTFSSMVVCELLADEVLNLAVAYGS